MKIGIILDSTKTSWYIHDLVEWIKKNPKITLEVLLIQNIGNKKKSLLSEKFSKILDRIFFKIINIIEKRLIYIKYSQYKKHFLKYDLKKFQINEIDVQIQKSKNEKYFTYSDECINKIKKLNLDIIIRGGSGILKGKILNSAKFGIISFHHGDNLVNRGIPPGFWEVYEKNPKTGFTIQILTEQLDGGNILKRGHFRTEQFYYLNDIVLKERSNYYMKAVLVEINNTNELPSLYENYPYYNKLYIAPNFKESINYLSFRIYDKIKNYVLDKVSNKVWHVGFQQEKVNKFTFYKSELIKNPKNSFLADPFVIEHNKENYIFVEEYNFINKKGIISVYKISKNGSQKIGVALEENFHLSFPYIFEFENNYYMAPETNEVNEIRLYKCEEFPLKWKYEKTMLKSIKASDTMIFNFNNYWWLMTTFSNSGHNTDSELQIFYSKNGPLTDNWISFKKNPVITNPDIGRNGGIFFDDKKLFRVAQSFGFNAYGKKINIQEIIKLDPDNFIEKEFCSIEAKFLKNLIGIHHLHSNNNYTVHDFCKREFKL
jgi:folate-dependent phosphoribosylglycinamide formyltransferase PurN|tara:strand:- start:54 stop:1685 length:1632 start_codon:yes stop_codon:yes gene_type:complete